MAFSGCFRARETLQGVLEYQTTRGIPASLRLNAGRHRIVWLIYSSMFDGSKVDANFA